MKTILTIMACLTVLGFLSSLGTLHAESDQRIELPPPQTDIGKPLMQVLKERHTTRRFDSKPLPPQTLSNLLWAAFGVNRPDSGKRTAPSAHNWQEIDIYAATADGLYRYDAKANVLIRILSKDVRASTGGQGFVADAPLNLIYVADYSRMTDVDLDQKKFYAAADTGFIGQNVYLFCASEGLATVIRGYVDRPALGEIMGLGPNETVTLCQTVGFPL